MARKKRNFIDKNKSVTFKLVGRSQDDPLFVDESAPQYVLVEKRSKLTIPIDLDEGDEDAHKNKKLSTTARKEEQSKFGIYFDDDYDYLQHLIDAKEVPTLANVEIQPSSARNQQSDDPADKLDVEGDGSDFPELSKPSTSKTVTDQPKALTKLMLPSSVFDSTVREKEDLTKRAALPVGPQLDWDPDIVEAMDDDFEFDDPDNQIDDDFVMQAMKQSGSKVAAADDDGSYKYDFNYQSMDPKISLDALNEEDNDEEYDDDDDDLSVCGAASSGGDDDDDEYYEAQDEFPADAAKMKELLKKRNFKKYFGLGEDDDEEDDGMTAKSASTHFTEYSMSSSVLPRNDQLKLLDEKFEQMFIREYADDTGIGALDGDEEAEEGGSIDPNQSDLVAKLAEEYHVAKQAHFGLEYEKNQAAVDFVRAHMKKIIQEVDDESGDDEDSDSSTDTEYEEIEIEDPGRKGDKERHDCESILSTYSNTNYHPRVLRDTDRYGNILLGRKSAQPNHIRFDPRTGMPVGTVGDKQLDPTRLTAANLAALDQGTVRTSMSRLSELSVRPKNETPEERRARKKELKDFRSQRRAEKKANKLAFAEEKTRIHKTELNNAVQKKIAVI